MPRSYSISDARKLLPEIVERAKYYKETALITKHGKAVAAITPVPGSLQESNAKKPVASVGASGKLPRSSKRG